MTEPCIDPASFEVVDGVVGPHSWLQWRHVASEIAAGALVDPLTDIAEVLIHDLQAEWTNTTPVPQHAYGLCTRGASQVIVSANRRFVVEQRRGWASGTAPATPTPNQETGRHGGGLNMGTAQSGAVSVFGIWERRQGTATTPIGPDVVLAPGQTLKIRVAVYVVRITWAPPFQSNYIPETEMLIDSGDTQLDIYAYPALT